MSGQDLKQQGNKLFSCRGTATTGGVATCKLGNLDFVPTGRLQDWQISFNSASFTNLLKNVDETNNAYRLLNSALSVNQIFYLPSGGYNVGDIGRSITNTLLANGFAENTVVLRSNNATLGSSLYVAPGYVVDLTMYGSIAPLIGFEAVQVPAGTNLSPMPLMLRSWTQLYVNCDKAVGAFSDSSNSTTIVGTLSVDPAYGEHVTFSPSYKTPLAIRDMHAFNSIVAYITNEQDEVMDFKSNMTVEIVYEHKRNAQATL